MFSQTAEYALRAVMFLANAEDTPASSERISREVSVPKAYLSKIMRDLVVAEIVASNMGPNGGFSLSRDPTEISVLNVINAVDPIHRIESCPLGRPEHVKLCPLHKQLDASIAHVEKTLSEVTISQLSEKDKSHGCKGLTQRSNSGLTEATTSIRIKRK